MKIKIQLEIEENDIRWLEQTYGNTWPKRMEQHIEHEIMLRKRDQTELKLREPWDY